MPHTKPPKRSTADLQTSQFNAHGLVNIWQDGAIIHYDATGPFNAELVDLLAIAQRDFLEVAKPSGLWASIGTMHGSAMTSPEGIARYAAILSVPKPASMTPAATAFVMGPEVEGYRIMSQHYTGIFEAMGRPFQIFDTLEEAKAWVRGFLNPQQPPA